MQNNCNPPPVNYFAYKGVVGGTERRFTAIVSPLIQTKTAIWLEKLL